MIRPSFTRPKTLLHLLAVVCAALLATPVEADEIVCFSGFATLAENDPEADKLIVRTFNDLLDKVGGSKLSLEVLRAMDKSSDPFRAPEDGTGDLGSLNSSLREFKSLLEKKNWNGERVKKLLLTEVRNRVRHNNLAKVKVDEAVMDEGALLDRTLALQARMPVTVSGSGKWTLSPQSDRLPGHPDKASVIVINNHTGSTDAQPFPSELFGGKALFLEDGNRIAFVNKKNGQLTVVPFDAGVIDWAKSQGSSVKTTSSEGNVNLFPSSDPDVLFGAVVGESLVRYDLGTHAHRLVPLPHELKGKNIWDHGPIASTNLLYFYAREQLFITSYDRDGKLTLVDYSRTLPKFQGPFVSSTNGEFFVSTGANSGPRVTAIPTKGGAPQPLLNRSGGDEFSGYVLQVVPHPLRNEMLVFSDADGGGRNTNIDVVDLGTRKSQAQFSLPFRFSNPPTISPSGRILVGADNEGNVRVVNLAQRLQ